MSRCWDKIGVSYYANFIKMTFLFAHSIHNMTYFGVNSFLFLNFTCCTSYTLYIPKISIVSKIMYTRRNVMKKYTNINNDYCNTFVLYILNYYQYLSDTLALWKLYSTARIQHCIISRRYLVLLYSV